MQDPLSHVTWLDKTIDPFSYSFRAWLHTLGPHRAAFLKVGDYSPSGFCPVSHVTRFQAPCLPEAPSSLTDSVPLGGETAGVVAAASMRAVSQGHSGPINN